MPNPVAEFFRRLFGQGATITESTVQPRAFLGSRSGWNSTGSKWPGGLSASGATPSINHWHARRNARSAYLDSVQAHALVQRHADTVVDVGLKLKSQPVAAMLGIEEQAAADWSRDVERRFHLWASDRASNRQEIMNFYQFQRLVAIAQPRDGEYFVRLHYNNRRDLQNPLQVGMIEPGAVLGDTMTHTDGSISTFSDGIERDAAGREVAYHVQSFEGGEYKQIRIPARGARSGRRLMLHGFQPEWPKQIRGYPRFFHALQEFENVTDFSLAHIKKAINQSNITMYVKPSQDEAASSPFQGVTNDSPAGFTPELVDGLGSGSPLESTSIQYIPVEEATIGAPGSVGVFNLQGGEDLKSFQDTAPVQEFGQFVDAFTSHLAASMSMPLEVLLMKFEQNYSASRAALIMFWRIAQMWRAEMASDLLNPVFEAWLSGEISASRISAPGWSDPRLRRAWLNCSWAGVPMPNIDPQKTAKADQMYVEMGAQTLQDVAQNLNGSDIESNKSQIARELDGLPNPPWGSGAAQEAQTAQAQAMQSDGEDNEDNDQDDDQEGDE